MCFKVSRYRYIDGVRQFTQLRWPVIYIQKVEEDHPQYACGSVGVK